MELSVYILNARQVAIRRIVVTSAVIICCNMLESTPTNQANLYCAFITLLLPYVCAFCCLSSAIDVRWAILGASFSNQTCNLVLSVWFLGIFHLTTSHLVQCHSAPPVPIYITNTFSDWYLQLSHGRMVPDKLKVFIPGSEIIAFLYSFRRYEDRLSLAWSHTVLVLWFLYLCSWNFNIAFEGLDTFYSYSYSLKSIRRPKWSSVST